MSNSLRYVTASSSERRRASELSLGRNTSRSKGGNIKLDSFISYGMIHRSIGTEKNLGCCRNFWGDFGGNAFNDGLRACFNHEKMRYARAMLRGRKPPRDDIPCSTCEIYHAMRDRSDWITRGAGVEAFA